MATERDDIEPARRAANVGLHTLLEGVRLMNKERASFGISSLGVVLGAAAVFLGIGPYIEPALVRVLPDPLVGWTAYVWSFLLFTAYLVYWFSGRRRVIRELSKLIDAAETEFSDRAVVDEASMVDYLRHSHRIVPYPSWMVRTFGASLWLCGIGLLGIVAAATFGSTAWLLTASMLLTAGCIFLALSLVSGERARSARP